MTSWQSDEWVLDDPDTCTLEQYREWQLELPLFDDLPRRLPPQTIRLRGEWL